MTGNPRCQKPYFLKEIPIQDVAIQDFTCDEGKKSTTILYCVGSYMGYYRINPIIEINIKIMMRALVSNKPPSCPDSKNVSIFPTLECFFLGNYGPESALVLLH